MRGMNPTRPLLLAALVLLPLGAAHAQIPSSLKSSCTMKQPALGFSYLFCDDGVPSAGGLTPNVGGANAVLVPAKYDGFAGLPSKSADASSMPGADTDGNVALDVDISIPTLAAPAGGYPLIVMMHGCCSGDKTGWEDTSFEGAGEHWHYNNAWFAARGYVVLTYTARGFVNSMNQGSTGQTQLDSRRFEINDFQYLAGLLADDPFFSVNPQKVVVTGGSYGGGFSWLAFTDPIWMSPGGKAMKLAAAAPRYGWTDLVFSLVPNGVHSFDAASLPAFDGSDSTNPLGIPKKSINAALYASGQTGVPPGKHTTFPPEIDDSFQCLNATYPFDMNPSCATTISTTLPEFLNDRSAYYQSDFFAKVATDPTYRTPLFNAGTLTDPLLPDPGVLRRLQPLRAEQGEGVGRRVRHGPPSLHPERLSGREPEQEAARPPEDRRDLAAQPLHRLLHPAAGQPAPAPAALRRDGLAADLPAERVRQLPGGRAGPADPGAELRAARARHARGRHARHGDDHEQGGGQHARRRRRPGRELRQPQPERQLPGRDLLGGHRRRDL